MTKLTKFGVLGAGAVAILLAAAPVKVDLANGGLSVKSADARVFKGGSNEKAAGTVVNTRGGGHGGRSR